MADNYFGLCPQCGGNDGYRNVGRNHWFVCHTCRTRWCAGSNLFSGWREETKEEWAENAWALSAYREVEPVHPYTLEEILATLEPPLAAPD
jgi:hypothetical protein